MPNSEGQQGMYISIFILEQSNNTVLPLIATGQEFVKSSVTQIPSFVFIKEIILIGYYHYKQPQITKNINS